MILEKPFGSDIDSSEALAEVRGASIGATIGSTPVSIPACLSCLLYSLPDAAPGDEPLKSVKLTY